MLFAHCSLIQEGEAALFYRFSKPLNGYVIAGLIVAPNVAAKLSFAKIWKYFLSKVVTSDDMYCSILEGSDTSLFDSYLEYHSEVDGLKIYKVDNAVKKPYSSYVQYLEGQASGK